MRLIAARLDDPSEPKCVIWLIFEHDGKIIEKSVLHTPKPGDAHALERLAYGAAKATMEACRDIVGGKF